MLTAMLILAAVSIGRAAREDFPPCALTADGTYPGLAQTLNGCIAGCDIMCPSMGMGTGHVKCYQACNALYSK
jgi:hypothetical protein